jgi:hypothetical protein
MNTPTMSRRKISANNGKVIEATGSLLANGSSEIVTECLFATANAIMISAIGITTIAVRIFRSTIDPARNERIRQARPDLAAHAFPCRS